MMAFIDDDSTMDDSVKEDEFQSPSSAIFTRSGHLHNGWSEAASRDVDSSPRKVGSSSHQPVSNVNNNNNNNNAAQNISGGANVNSGN